MKRTKKSVIVTIIVLAVLVIGAILYYGIRGSSVTTLSTTYTVSTTPTSTTPSSSSPLSNSVSASISIPSLPPFMTWTLATSSSVWYQEVNIDKEVSDKASPPLTIYVNTTPLSEETQYPTVPSKTWISSVSDADASSNQFYNTFYNYYDSILTKNGWSYEQINLPNATINGDAASGVYANYWSYLKISGGNLYMISPGYSGNIYEVNVSDPIPLKQLGL